MGKRNLPPLWTYLDGILFFYCEVHEMYVEVDFGCDLCKFEELRESIE